jgi:hypothetical protein
MQISGTSRASFFPEVGAVRTPAEVRFFSLVTALFLVSLAACNKPQDQSAQNQPVQNQPADVSNGDPANGNLASANQADYQQPAPVAAPAPQDYAPAPGDSDNSQYYDQNSSYDQPIQASEPPPPLPDYNQPPAPGDDYVWTPGYWSYANAGYYWVPGAWVLAPYVGALWTPPWWGYDSGDYHWHSGYWGPHIGYYGGINYGFGYTGRGYYGAYWNHGRLDCTTIRCRTTAAIASVTTAGVEELRRGPRHRSRPWCMILGCRQSPPRFNICVKLPPIVRNLRLQAVERSQRRW